MFTLTLDSNRGVIDRPKLVYRISLESDNGTQRPLLCADTGVNHELHDSYYAKAARTPS